MKKPLHHCKPIILLLIYIRRIIHFKAVSAKLMYFGTLVSINFYDSIIRIYLFIFFIYFCYELRIMDYELNNKFFLCKTKLTYIKHLEIIASFSK